VEKTGPRGEGSAESSTAPVLDQDAALEMLKGAGEEAGQRDSSIRSSSSAYNPTVPLSAVTLPISRDEEPPPPTGSRLPVILIILALIFLAAVGMTIASFYVF
jgi:hypothetical protein